MPAGPTGHWQPGHRPWPPVPGRSFRRSRQPRHARRRPPHRARSPWSLPATTPDVRHCGRQCDAWRRSPLPEQRRQDQPNHRHPGTRRSPGSPAPTGDDDDEGACLRNDGATSETTGRRSRRRLRWPHPRHQRTRQPPARRHADPQYGCAGWALHPNDQNRQR